MFWWPKEKYRYCKFRNDGLISICLTFACGMTLCFNWQNFHTSLDIGYIEKYSHWCHRMRWYWEVDKVLHQSNCANIISLSCIFTPILSIYMQVSMPAKYLRYSILMSMYRTEWNILVNAILPEHFHLKCISSMGPASVSKDLLANYTDVIPTWSPRKKTFIIRWRNHENISRVTGPLCEEFIGHQWIPLTKVSDAELWCFLLSAPWINGWVNNREAGDFRRHCGHYEVIVM